MTGLDRAQRHALNVLAATDGYITPQEMAISDDAAAIRSLKPLGLVAVARRDGREVWELTEDGRAAVEELRAATGNEEED